MFDYVLLSDYISLIMYDYDILIFLYRYIGTSSLSVGTQVFSLTRITL